MVEKEKDEENKADVEGIEEVRKQETKLFETRFKPN